MYEGGKSKEVEVAEPVEAAAELPVPEVEQLREATMPMETPTEEIATEPAATVEPSGVRPIVKPTP